MRLNASIIPTVSNNKLGRLVFLLSFYVEDYQRLTKLWPTIQTWKRFTYLKVLLLLVKTEKLQAMNGSMSFNIRCDEDDMLDGNFMNYRKL